MKNRFTFRLHRTVSGDTRFQTKATVHSSGNVGSRTQRSKTPQPQQRRTSHDHPQQPRRTHRQHPARQAQPHPAGGRRQSHHRRQSRILQPRRLLQGPHRRAHHRRRRTVRPAEARRRDRRAHLGQHRRRPGPGRPAARLPHDFHPAGQGLRIQARGAARLRCRSHRHTDRRRPGRPALLLPGRRTTGQHDSRRLPPEPVRQPERPAEPLLHHRPRDLGGYGPQGHALRGRHWHRRHHLRHRQVPQGSLQRRGQGHRLRPGRLHLLRFLTRRSPPVRHRGRGGGLLPQGFRPEHHRRHRARIRRRSL